MSLPALSTQSSVPQMLPVQLYDPIYRLKPGSQALYGYFWVYYLRTNGQFPSRTESMAALNIGADAYQTYLKGLIEKGFIVILDRESGGKFSKNDYILTYPNDSFTSNPCTENPVTVKPTTEMSGIRLVPCTENVHFKPFSCNNSSNSINNYILNTQEEKEESSSSSSQTYDYTEIINHAKVLKEDRPAYAALIDLFLQEVLKQKKSPDLEGFSFIVDKFIEKTGGRSIGGLKGYAKSFFNNEYDLAQVGIAIKQKTPNDKTNHTAGPGSDASPKKNYEEIRKVNEQEEQRRREYIKKVAPEVFVIDMNVQSLNVERMRHLDNPEKGSKIKAEIDVLNNKRDAILKTLGFDEYYLDKIYSCSSCNDTGLLENGETCSCRELI